METVGAFLPSVERAKGAGLEIRVDRGALYRERSLLEETPAEERRLLAIVLRGRVVLRSSWQRAEEMSAKRAEALSRERPPVAFEEQRFIVAVGLTTPERACRSCSPTPGRVTCLVCIGKGQRLVPDRESPIPSEMWVPCDRCDGTGLVGCGPCEGSARTQSVLVEYGEDQVATVSRTFAPSLPAAIEHALRVHFDSWPDFPDQLEHDLEAPASGATPYRSMAHETPRRWGFSLVDADDARAMLARVRGESALHAVQAFTIPILVLAYEGGAVAVIAPAPGGRVVGFGGFVD